MEISCHDCFRFLWYKEGGIILTLREQNRPMDNACNLVILITEKMECLKLAGNVLLTPAHITI